MINAFRCKDTEALFAGAQPAPLPCDCHGSDPQNRLRSPPGNRLETLHGDRAGQCSIRINDQWRLCFRWNGNAEDVEIVDYH